MRELEKLHLRGVMSTEPYPEGWTLDFAVGRMTRRTGNLISSYTIEAGLDNYIDARIEDDAADPDKGLWRFWNRKARELAESNVALRSQLEEARENAAESITWRTDELNAQLAQARENALEEAAGWHEEQALEIDKIATENAHHYALRDKLKLHAGSYRSSAAAIRKLKGPAKPKPVPSLGKLFDDLATKQRLIGEEFEKFMADVEDTTEADGEGAIRKLKEKP